MDNEIFVFGSNLAGIHGVGAAKYARDHWIAPMMIQAPPNCLLPYSWQEFGYWADDSRQWFKSWA